MRLKPIAKAALLLWCVLGIAFGAHAQAPLKPFSADQVFKVGARTMMGTVHATSTAMRMESDANGKHYINIVRGDRKVVWTLIPDKKVYYEMAMPSLPDSAMLARNGTEAPNAQRQNAGTERVGDYVCDKTLVVANSGGRADAFTEWAAKELGGFVVKRQAQDGSWSVEYRNVQLASQDASLFEIPAGYQKMDLGMAH
jgi:hypothetical protein